MGESRDTHMGKTCDICGDVGYEELIRTCSQCTIGRHLYCMRVLVRDVKMAEDWVCEVCRPKKDIDSEKSGQTEDVLDSSGKLFFDLGRQVTCKRQKAVETGKVKFLPTEEVIKLSSGSTKNAFPLKSNFGSDPVPANFTPPLSKRTFMGSKTVGPYFNPIKVRRNTSFLQLGSVNPPRRGGVHISSSISQLAVKTSKESKGALVVPNKENVCKGHTLDATPPDEEHRSLHTKTDEAMTSSRPSTSRPRTTIVGSGRNFQDAAEPENSDFSERESWNRLKISLYRPHLPALYTTWTGGFKFLDAATRGEFYGGFLARPPCRVHRKAFEFSQKMPPILPVNLLPRCHLQADLFQNGCLHLCDIALYIFPLNYDERSQKEYNELFQLMEIKSSVMISYIDGVELFIFTSKQLHMDSQDVFSRSNRDFFCGVFRHAKDNQMKVYQNLPSLVFPLERTHDDSANMVSSKAFDMNINMVGGKIVGIPDMVVSKESTRKFNESVARENLDVISGRKFSTVSGDLNSVIQPIKLEFKPECCNDSNSPSKSTEKIKSKFNLEPAEYPLKSSLGRACGSMSETDTPPGFEVVSKLNSIDRVPKATSVVEKKDLDERRIKSHVKSIDRVPKAPSVVEKKDLDERRIKSHVKEEIGCQGVFQVAFGGSSPQPQGSIEDASLPGSQKVHQVLAYHPVNDPSAACPPPSSLSVEGTNVGPIIKIEGNDNEKPLESREKKGLQGAPFLSKDKSQVIAGLLCGPCAVDVKAEVQEVVNEHSAAYPPCLLGQSTKIGLEIQTLEHEKEKPIETREKKGMGGSSFLCKDKSKMVAGSFNGPCAVEGTNVGLIIKIEGNDNEKPLESREKKGLQGAPFLSKDKSQVIAGLLCGPCAVDVKAEVQEVVNEHSAAYPPCLLGQSTKIGLEIQTLEHEKEKPIETREKKGMRGSSFLCKDKSKMVAGSFNGPCAVEDKAEMQKVEYERVNTGHRLQTTLPRNMEKSLCLGLAASIRVKLSVAGRSSGNPGAASIGGLIRDESGEWIVGYNLNLGTCGSLATDLWALFQGIKFTWDRGYRKVLVESDSNAAMECLKKAPSHLSSNRALIESCIDLISRKWDCKVYSIRREENLCANWLATHVEGCPLGLSIINVPPSELIPLLEDDRIRVACSYS
ncbi:uncharacterized protein LOC111291283 isoform X2 [Durio zibethinus]|uniref:Uncharacterized protein LOC111291283 isoform X2 n=1 Tax=Durio zibethinus TaxID=66656 RepID=A0A6P5YDW2_DURZI|nr:uncharacterized protein LOC111291283 isoform X2 [Durio zibethinus]